MGGRLPGDKLSLYLEAEKDSLERARLMGNDTLVDRSITGDLTLPQYDSDKGTLPGHNGTLPAPRGVSSSGIVPPVDPNEARIRERLELLNRELNKATTPALQKETESPANPEMASTMAQLEMMMQQMPVVDQTDQQMQQVKDVMSSILDVQHPELVKARLKAASLKNKERVYQVNNRMDNEVVELLAPAPSNRSHPPRVAITDTTGGPHRDSLTGNSLPAQPNTQLPNNFYELDVGAPSQPAGNALTAVVHGTQIMLPRGTIKMRLTQDVYVQGILIPTGTQVHGECKLDGERLNIEVNAIRYGEGRYPVTLSVYDYDGLPGIRIRDAISRQSGSQGADQALQSLQLYSMDPSIGAQAAAAGMETVKSLLNKKIKLVKATVKADYPVLLIDNNADR